MQLSKIAWGYNLETAARTDLIISDSVFGHEITLYNNFQENRGGSGVNLDLPLDDLSWNAPADENLWMQMVIWQMVKGHGLMALIDIG